MNKITSDIKDSRWGNYIPWFLRNKDFTAPHANLPLFVERVGQRLDQYFLFESQTPNSMHFGDKLETESLQRFRHDRPTPFNNQIRGYFASETLSDECSEKVWKDPAVEEAQTSLDNLHDAKKIILQNNKEELKKIEAEINTAELRLDRVANDIANHIYASIFNDRLGVLEAILQILPDSAYFPKLICDIRRSFAEVGLMLDVQGSPPLITPLEEPLLQKEVIDNLLPRLYDKFPERAEELISCYHRVRTGDSLDSVFSEAFKTLEEIARSITGERKFEFKREHLTKHFPLLHSTIHGTMEKLRDHRGAEAAHGKVAPDLHEIRYLLFSICNVALLLLDYPKE